jgi:hypothetical protein
MPIEKIIHRHRASHSNSLAAPDNTDQTQPRRSEAEPHWMIDAVKLIGET